MGITRSEIACVIRNQSARGAELKVPIEAAISGHFAPYVPVDDVSYPAVVRWRHNDRAGVQFVESGPKPPLRAGCSFTGIRDIMPI